MLNLKVVSDCHNPTGLSDSTIIVKYFPVGGAAFQYGWSQFIYQNISLTSLTKSVVVFALGICN